MKKIYTIFAFTVLCASMFAQRKPSDYKSFQQRIGLEAVFNIKNPDFYRTSINLKGIPVFVEGSINDIFSGGENIFNQSKDWVSGIFGHGSSGSEEPDITENEDGTKTYKDKDGNVFTERLVDRNRIQPRVFYELAISPWKRVAEVSVRAGNGKYNLLSFSAEGSVSLFGTSFFELRKLLSGISYNEDNVLNMVFLSGSFGYDSSYPGWSFVTKKNYQAIGGGISVPIFERTGYISLGSSFQVTKPQYKDKTHSTIYLNTKFKF